MEKEQTKKEQTPEEATTVGQYLQLTRVNQKKSIESVAKALCIRKIYIKAIEESDFVELPPIPYGVGFVRSYANYLGLNSERIVQCYKEEAMPKKQHNTTAVVTSHPESTKPDKYQILFGLFGLLLLYAVWFFYNSNRTALEQELPETSSEAIEPAAETTIPDEIIIPEESDVENIDSYSADENALNDETPIDEPAQPAVETGMVVKFNGESWIEIRDADKIYITGIYDKGFEYKVPNKSGLIFSVGKQHNVDVYLNGELIKITRPQKQTKISLDEYLNH